MEPRLEIVYGSDALRGGVYLELGRVDGLRRHALLEVFRSDRDGSLTFYADARCALPFVRVEEFMKRAQAELATRPSSPSGAHVGTA